MDEVFHTFAQVDSLPSESLDVVFDPPILVPKSSPQIVLDIPWKVNDFQQLLGSMGVHEGGEQIEDEHQVLFTAVIA